MEIEPRVVHCAELGSLRLPAVYVGPPALAPPGVPSSPRFASPFRGGAPLCRRRRFRELLARCPRLAAAARRELRGKNLACWCPPHPCHAEVLWDAIAPRAGPGARSRRAGPARPLLEAAMVAPMSASAADSEAAGECSICGFGRVAGAGVCDFCGLNPESQRSGAAAGPPSLCTGPPANPARSRRRAAEDEPEPSRSRPSGGSFWLGGSGGGEDGKKGARRPTEPPPGPLSTERFPAGSAGGLLPADPLPDTAEPCIPAALLNRDLRARMAAARRARPMPLDQLHKYFEMHGWSLDGEALLMANEMLGEPIFVENRAIWTRETLCRHYPALVEQGLAPEIAFVQQEVGVFGEGCEFEYVARDAGDERGFAPVIDVLRGRKRVPMAVVATRLYVGRAGWLDFKALQSVVRGVRLVAAQQPALGHSRVLAAILGGAPLPTQPRLAPALREPVPGDEPRASR